MRSIYVPVLVTILVACSPKPNSETAHLAADSANAKASDTLAAKKLDSIPKVEVKPTVAPVVAEVKAEKADPSKKAVRCKFKSLEANPCAVYTFDCAKFDNVGTSSLKPAQQKLWSSLMVFPANEGDFPSANPEYLGKTFEIAYKKATGEICNGTGNPGKGEIFELLEFKLAGK